MATNSIMRVERLAIPMKLAGIGFLAYHCATADIRFNPIWVAVYVGVAFILANACVAARFVISKLRPKTKATQPAFTNEESVCVGKLHAQGDRIRRKPWLFLLIAGEDGFFFLPLLYLGITPVSAATAAALFALMHYRDKPNSALAGTFLFSAANVLIVLPHGILPMVIGHYILDAVAFSMAPVLQKWVETDQEKTRDAQPQPAPCPSSRQL